MSKPSIHSIKVAMHESAKLYAEAMERVDRAFSKQVQASSDGRWSTADLYSKHVALFLARAESVADVMQKSFASYHGIEPEPGKPMVRFHDWEVHDLIGLNLPQAPRWWDAK